MHVPRLDLFSRFLGFLERIASFFDFFRIGRNVQ